MTSRRTFMQRGIVAGAGLALPRHLWAPRSPAGAAQFLVPMDDAQEDHLKAYGLDVSGARTRQGGRMAAQLSRRLVSSSRVSRSCAAMPRSTGNARAIGRSGCRRDASGDRGRRNMDAIPLEKAPKVADLHTAEAPPWDDAVRLALTYAGIPYTQVWDDEVMRRGSAEIRLAASAPRGFHRPVQQVVHQLPGAPWFQELVARDRNMDRRAARICDGPGTQGRREKIRAFVERGGLSVRHVRGDRDAGSGDRRPRT